MFIHTATPFITLHRKKGENVDIIMYIQRRWKKIPVAFHHHHYFHTFYSFLFVCSFLHPFLYPHSHPDLDGMMMMMVLAVNEVYQQKGMKQRKFMYKCVYTHRKYCEKVSGWMLGG